jgi:hypothetical protein
MMHIKIKKIIMVAGVLAVTGAHADDKLDIHGYGYQDYRRASENSLDGADQRGTWNNEFLGLVMSMKFTDRDTAWAQLESSGSGQTAITWAFVDHRFTDNVSAHVGRVKFPFGLYSEFVDNKWLQISAIEPSMYNAAADFVYDAYEGVGVDWTSGSLVTQVYGGNVYVNPSLAGGSALYPAPIDASVPPTNDRRLLGARVTWNTPYDGLRFMVSATEIHAESTALQPTLGQLGREYHTMVSADYVSDRFDIKSEYAGHSIPALDGYTGVASNAWYVQAGYKMGVWMPYVRYDRYLADRLHASDPTYYQKDSVVGVNYKINDNVNARIEDHFIHGYGLAATNGEIPVDSLVTPTVWYGKTNWNMIAAEVNFLF